MNLAYLQPFEDGNKRTSRLSANIPLMLYNCAPLSFLDVEAQDYAYAMMGVYERGDVALAVDLFTWSYRRSIRKYAVQLDAAGVPDPVRLRFREQLNAAIGRVVRARQTADAAVATLALSGDDARVFRPMLAEELRVLDLYNCARYRLAMEQVQEWIEAGGHNSAATPHKHKDCLYAASIASIGTSCLNFSRRPQPGRVPLECLKSSLISLPIGLLASFQGEQRTDDPFIGRQIGSQ